jgi:hypothetical protein
MGRISVALCAKINMIQNFWQDKLLPEAWSWHPRNCEEPYYGVDRPPNCDQNWNIPISYKFNKNGFRTYNFELDCKEINIALGCSQTLGVGLPVEMTWPFLIERETNTKTFNLGLGGASSDTVARLLTNISGLFDIANVYILWPSDCRFENYIENDIVEILPNRAALEQVWYMNQSNSQQRFYKNQVIVHNLQRLHNFKLHELHYDTTNWRIRGDLARDQIHSGYKSNLNLVKLFLTKND